MNINVAMSESKFPFEVGTLLTFVLHSILYIDTASPIIAVRNKVFPFVLETRNLGKQISISLLSHSINKLLLLFEEHLRLSIPGNKPD